MSKDIYLKHKILMILALDFALMIFRDKGKTV